MGLPNAGKSTFLNTLLKEKVSITSANAQTTRHRVIGVYNHDQAQMVFLDLPGIHRPQYEMNRRMMRTVRQGLMEADIALHLIDVTLTPKGGDEFITEMIHQHDHLVHVIAVNKMDQINRHKMIPRLTEIQDKMNPKHLIPISAQTGENLEELIKVLKLYLPEGDWRHEPDYLTDTPQDTWIAELIREKILRGTKEELPHATTVVVEHRSEEDGALIIGALIVVEKANHRQILLGKGGQKIKTIRQYAQRELKKELNQEVVLDLHIKVVEGWRADPKFLDQGASW
jgi:GTP-binding protein Era